MASQKLLGLLKQVSLALFLVTVLTACGSEDDSSSDANANSPENDNGPISETPEPIPDPEPSPEPDPEPSPEPDPAPTDTVKNSVRQFTFNHSLWDHASSQHTNTVTGYWVGEFASASGTTYGWNGQFGQLDYHELPPSPVLGSTNSTDVFQGGVGFADINIDNVLIMPPNFVQRDDAQVDQAETNAAQRVIDYLLGSGQKSGLPIYIYEHWPEAASENLNDAEWQAYHDRTTGAYHQWFINYQNQLMGLYPNTDFRLIPVGTIIAEILQNPAFMASELSFTEYYEDNSPHGKPNIYFLAGLITYQAMYGQRVNSDYLPPIDAYSGVSAEIANEFSVLNEYVWSRLNHYNANGVRIWP